MNPKIKELIEGLRTVVDIQRQRHGAHSYADITGQLLMEQAASVLQSVFDPENNIDGHPSQWGTILILPPASERSQRRSRSDVRP